ncbi:MAG: hypothetical protein AAGN15_18765 [Cyanobacteria bacterium J06581_3]
MKQYSVPRWLKGFVISSCLSLLCAPMAIAQSGELTRAEVYRLQNIVELLLRNQSPRQARVQDTLAPRDAMQTGSRSLAELIFNEGSLARIGSNSVFRFVPGTRRYQLPGGGTRAETVLQLQQGVAMVTSPAGGESAPSFGGGTDGNDVILLSLTSSTPDALLQMTPNGVALIVVKLEGTTFISLTDGLVATDLLGNNKVSLQGGQLVTVKDGVFGPVESFDLRQLYRTSALTSGLGPDEEALLLQEPEEVQETLREARVNTLSAIATQDATLQGLCTLDARGGDSTLSSNCVTTGADDPFSEFEDRREDVVSPPVETDPGSNGGQSTFPDQGPTNNNSTPNGQNPQ